METPKKNKKIIGAFFKALFRGLVTSLPFGIGNIFIGTVDALSGNKLPDKKLLEDPNLSKDEAADIDKFRRWSQIVIQLTVCVIVIYAFFTKQINIVQLLEYLTPSEPVVP